MTFALGLVLAAALLVAFGAAVGEAQTSDGPGPARPSLSLAPPSGQPGARVAAAVSGFEACDDSADEVLDESGEGAEPGVLILWDGSDRLDRAELDDGEAQTEFTVPAAASFGRHVVVARCDGDSNLEAEETFLVETPLVVGPPAGEETPDEVEPPGGEEVPDEVEPPGGEETPDEVEPPGEAEAPDDGDAADEVEAPVVEAPSVEAEPAGPGSGGESEVPGLLVAAPTGSQLGLLAAIAAALLAAWLVRRLLRSRRDRRWVRRHVRVERGPTTTGGPVVLEDGDRPTRVMRLEPHLDSDTPTLEEVAP